MAYTNLSAAYHVLDQNEKAIEYYEKGLKIFRLKGIRQGEGRSCLFQAITSIVEITQQP